MNGIVAIAGADAAERMRRFAFLLTIAVALYAGYLYVPQASAAYHTVVIHGHSGIYNSAFYGATIAALTDGFLTLIGFFLVRGAVERDVECKVSEIVSASPVRKSTFVLSKWLSSAAVLWSISGVSYLAAMVMQVLRGHAFQVDPSAYLMPYLLITVPSMAFVAAIATAFDIVPFLRGILGGVAFVILWPALLAPSISAGAGVVPAFDPLGFNVLSSSLINAEHQAFPTLSSPDVNFGVIMTEHLGAPFLFPGFTWTGEIVAQRLAWFFVAAVIVLLASAFFDRFRRESARKRNGAFIDVGRLVPNLSSLRIFRAEFALVANGASPWWYVGALGIVAAGAFVPLDGVVKFVLPVALIWPIERISALGARERRFGVEEIVSSTTGFASKTLAAQWLAGAFVVMLICSSCVLRLAIAGDAASIVASLMVAMAMSALALGLGATFGASRAFEAFFLVAWYLGPVQHLPELDFATSMVTAPAALCAASAAVAVLGVGATRWARRPG